MTEGYLIEYRRYRAIAEKAIAQVDEAGLNRIPCIDGNSIAMIMRHLSGNLKSRFTDFLTTDGEKPWRHRDQEFQEGQYSLASLKQEWDEAWGLIEQTLADLSDDDMEREVKIRGVGLCVREALNRSMAHVAYHVGQITLLARMDQQGAWAWISVPKGRSAEYNKNPTKEKAP